METNEQQVSRNIRASRIRRGKTQQMIANELNITERTYKNIEAHPLNYDISKLNEIADVIGCNVNEFFLPL